MASQALLFPYMSWAHRESFRSPYCLAQSGVPQADPALLGVLSGQDLLDHPGREAQPALEARLAALFAVSPERVLVTPSGSAAMLVCAMRWFRPGSAVLVDRPSYEPFRRLPIVFGAEPTELWRELRAGWHLDVEQGRALLATASRPAHVFLANPHNPTGALADASTMTRIADLAASRGGVLVSCEVYMEFARPAERVHAALLAPNAVSIGSLTKAYGLGPLRVGWILLGEEIARERETLVDMSYLAYVDPPTASLVAARRALDRLPELLAPLRRIEAESRPHWLRWLVETEGVRSTVPPFGIMAFPRIEGVPDTRALQVHLAAQHGVDVVPGEFFGLPGHLRVGCGVPEATLVEGLERLARGIQSWRAHPLA